MTGAPEKIAQQGLPESLDAERAVLGAVLMNSSAYDTLSELLAADDFSTDRHRRIFRAMQRLGEAGQPVEHLALVDELFKGQELEAVGGVLYLSDLTEGISPATNVSHYAGIVKEKSRLRRLAIAARDTASEAAGGHEESGTVAQRLIDRLDAVVADGGKGGPQPLGEIFSTSYRSLDDFVESGRRASGVETGFVQFDRLTCGLQPSDLILLAARPSMGKTAFALSVVRYAALELKVPVLFLSLEMSKEGILKRLVSCEARVDSHRLRSGFLNKEECRHVVAAMGRLCQAPIYIDDTSSIRLHEVRARARRLRREKEIGLVVLDYLQLMTAPRAENRNYEISALSRGLKALAKELNLPLLVLSQLSRAPETRGGDGRPRLSDLRDSGSQEQDADVVAFLYREDYYRRMAGEKVPPEQEGFAHLILAKQRNGPIGDVSLIFVSKYATFANFAGASQ